MESFKLKAFEENTHQDFKISANLTHKALYTSLNILINGPIKQIDLTPVDNLDKLYEGTCLEWFIKTPLEHYLEFNFDIHENEKLFYFESYRKPSKKIFKLQVENKKICLTKDMISLSIQIPHQQLTKILGRPFDELSFLPRVILKCTDYYTSHWAKQHLNSEKADFHKF